MVSIAGHPVTDDFSVYSGVACYSALKALNDYDTRAFTHNKAVAARIERPARFFRIIIAGRKGLHGRKTCHSQRTYDRFGTAGEHSICVAPLDNPEGLAYGMTAGSTCSYHLSLIHISEPTRPY